MDFFFFHLSARRHQDESAGVSHMGELDFISANCHGADIYEMNGS